MALTYEKMRQSHLRWFSHMQKKAIKAPVRMSDSS